MLRTYLTVADLSARDLTTLLDVADELAARPHARPDLLRGELVGLYFTKPSTRTRISFTAAIARLGGAAEMLGPTDLQLGRGETVEDTAAVVSRYARAFVIRTFDHAEVERFAAAATIPVVNALTDRHHPCQALADLLTLRARFGSLAGLRLAYVGDGNNVAHSLIEAGALAGMDVVVATPPELAPHPDLVERAAVSAAGHGGSVAVTDDPRAAVWGAQAVYTDVWLSMGDDPASQERRHRLLEPYRVDEALMALAAPDAAFLHCLPAHRGDEVVAAVIDGPQSVVFDQAGNRLPTEQALLVALVEGMLHGRPARGVAA